MAGLAGADMLPVYEAPRLGDVRHSQANVTRAKEVLGFEPQVGLAEGLKTTLAFYGALESAASAGAKGKSRSDPRGGGKA